MRLAVSESSVEVHLMKSVHFKNSKNGLSTPHKDD